MNKLKHIVLEACYRVAVSAAESAMNTTCFGRYYQEKPDIQLNKLRHHA